MMIKVYEMRKGGRVLRVLGSWREDGTKEDGKYNLPTKDFVRINFRAIQLFSIRINLI